MPAPRLPSGAPRIAACQVRAARAMLMWSIKRLAEESGVSESSIRRIESVFGSPPVTIDTLYKLHAFFEARGFEFTWRNDRPGLYWNDYPVAEAS